MAPRSATVDWTSLPLGSYLGLPFIRCVGRWVRGRLQANLSVDQGEEGAPGFYNNFWLDRGTTTVGTRRTSLIVEPPNGRFPELSPVGQRRTDERRAYLEEHAADSYVDRNTSDRCIVGFNAGPPITPLGYNQNLQVFQTPDHVVLVTEMVHTPRVVPLDGRPSLSDDIRQWSDDSRGHWKGDTLVVETANFRDERRWIPLGSAPAGTGSSGTMTLVERFTRLDEKTIEYRFTMTDPVMFTRAWTAAIPLTTDQAARGVTVGPLYEYACHEGNYSVVNILSGARAQEKIEAASGDAKEP